MPSRKTFCVPALVASFIATALLLLATVGSPTTFGNVTPFYLVSGTGLNNIVDAAPNANPDRQIDALRFGMWGYCSRGSVDGNYGYCSDNDNAWSARFNATTNLDSAAFGTSEIGQSWTRGLVVVVVAFVVSVVAFALSFFPHLTLQLVSSILHFLAFLLTLIAFAIQIAFYIYSRRQIRQVSSGANVMPGAAFYMTLISLPFLLFAAFTVCCGWRSSKRGDDYGASSEYTGAKASGGGPFSRFRRNKGEASETGEQIPMDSRARVMAAYEKDQPAGTY